MPLPPKSPLDKPSSTSSSAASTRRPSNSRHSSSEKSVTKSTKATAGRHHGVKAGSGQTRNLMADQSPPAEPVHREVDIADVVQDSNAKRHSAASSTSRIGREGDAGRKHGSARSSTDAEQSMGFSLPSGYRKGEIPKNLSAEDVEHFTANAQLQLNQHRESLAQQLGDRERRGSVIPPTSSGRSRVSPIHEETISPSLEAAFASPLVSALETTSTESAKTVRGEPTPSALPMRTPSFPFPNMRTTSQFSFSGHRPFTALSPTVNPSNYAGGHFDSTPNDQVLSGSVTPASTLRFQPSGSYENDKDDIYPTPNLYDLSLMLSSEPGLDAWWTTVVQLMRDVYKADRVSLSVPADPTDIENVPWGQKASYHAYEEDQLSLTYLPRGSSMVDSSVSTNDTSNSEENNSEESPPMLMPARHTRPGLLSRHSFTSYEDTKREPNMPGDNNRPSGPRPPAMARAKSYLSARTDIPPRTATLQNAQLNLKSLQDHIEYEDSKEDKSAAAWEHRDSAARDVQGRVFSVLQALDYEVDPLLDSSGVLRVLDRGKVIALTRDYPYIDMPEDQHSSGSKSSQASRRSKDPEKAKRTKAPELVSRLSSFLNTSRKASRSDREHGLDKGKSLPRPARDLDEERPRTPNYEEYEQAPPSPWVQSPAPSPATRTETGENPFFANVPVDEGTFNPETPHDYSKMQPLEAIGIDRSWTVLHIPLSHPLLSKPVQSMRLDAAAIESRSEWPQKGASQFPKFTDNAKTHYTEQPKEKRTPIAILSILSPVIPYPSNLRHSLESLSPHLATTFSLCRHYSNLENEIAGLSRKRPQTAGFGAVALAAKQAGGHKDLDELPSRDTDTGEYRTIPPRSTGGSMTSPSDYSTISRSTAGSPAGTPGWGPGTVGLGMDRRASGGSPGFNNNEGYFSPRARPGLSRMDTSSGSSMAYARRSNENSPADTRSQHHVNEERTTIIEIPGSRTDEPSTPRSDDDEGTHTANSTPKQEVRDSASSRPLSPRRQSFRTSLHQVPNKTETRPHTQLHSYGADFGATFQSLPATSAPTKFSVAPSRSRKGSISLPQDMPPPSDRLKGLMLDSLPAHVFVALPQTGEIVWVNNRYLTYRGQSVPELYEDPWGSIHPEEKEDYLRAWSHAIKTGEQFSMQVRIRRFDGTYRWFYTRAVGSRDVRGVIVQWYGSHMDIHDQHIAEVKAARQEEIEASEVKHRQLANLIPQIIFAATENDGVTFANEQWLSYTGQAFDDALGLGFMDYIHPEDLSRCCVPFDRSHTPQPKKPRAPSRSSSSRKSSEFSETPTVATIKGLHPTISRNNSSNSSSSFELAAADIAELTRSGVLKVTTDSDGNLSYTTEMRLRSKIGEYRWHLVRCVEVDNINLGSGDGSWLCACTDINDHKLLEAKLKEAMESKGKFLSNMSHEIRTPLIGISGMVNFLQDTVLNDEQSDYANTISSSANSLLNIINDILDLSKVDAGMMKLSHEWFHFRSLVEEVNEMVSTLAITKRLELNYVVDVEVPEMVKGDKFRIRQVLLNVIGNAIKFTTVGEVFTRCRVISKGVEHLQDDEVMVEFSVIDTGRGFTQEEGDLIFKPFSQIDGSSTRQHGGSGLGLVISRQLVELHGGKMEGSAIPEKGSTFTFSVVFGIATQEDHPEPLSTPALQKTVVSMSNISSEISARAMKQAGGNPLLANKFMQSPAAYSPRAESSLGSPTVMSSGSSNPSLRSFRSDNRSSVSSITQSLAPFQEAALASIPDLTDMKLALPEKHTPTKYDELGTVVSGRSIAGNNKGTVKDILVEDDLSRQVSASSLGVKHVRPPMYLILLVCPQTHSREATTQHIEITLPKDAPHQIIPLSSAAEAHELIGGDDPVSFTHIVLNLPSAEEIVVLIERILTSASLHETSIVVLSDPVQRQEVVKTATTYDYQTAKDDRVRFIYKPVKPSRFAVIFDPDKERDLSTDKNRSSAQQQVANQKQNYLDVGKRLGNRGLKVLLVEDNLVNQKVLLKYLSKVGIDVDLAFDGVECTDKVFAQPHSFYSLILVSSRSRTSVTISNKTLVRSPYASKGWVPNMS